ncbi:MAG: DUF2948 family protein [Alphaproteobacteria bacterium]
MSGGNALKLRAEDDADLAIIAACLSGAIGCLNEMAYDRKARRFAAILVRRLWQTAPEADTPNAGAPEAVAPQAAAPAGKPALGRMRAGLHFDHVSAVRYRRLDRRAPHALLHLVSIVSAPLSERFGIILSFQGGGEVFLEVDKLSGRLRDLDAPRQDTASQQKT